MASLSTDDCWEPCDTCSRGIARYRGWDGKRRCATCTTKLVKANGWNVRFLPRPKRVRKPSADEDQEKLF